MLDLEIQIQTESLKELVLIRILNEFYAHCLSQLEYCTDAIKLIK